MPPFVIKVSNLAKYYGKFKALDSISFSVEKGSIYGFLGTNGAGKSTTIRTMLGLQKPDEGEVLINGFNPAKDPIHALQSLGYAPEIPLLQSFFTGEQLLDSVGKIFGLDKQTRQERIRQLLELVGLKDWSNKRIGKYSKGMTQRLSIALALINDPMVLIMDEPTIGMDPQAMIQFRNLFVSLSNEGKTVFFSSHQLDEVQRICTNVGMISCGRIVFDGPMAQVMENFTKQWVVEVEIKNTTDTMISNLKKLSYVDSIRLNGNKMLISLKDKKDFRGEIAAEIFKQEGVLLGLNLVKPTLEDVYLQACKEVKVK
jgi:ABC-2 type transport system ATP-binding protein